MGDKHNHQTGIYICIYVYIYIVYMSVWGDNQSIHGHRIVTNNQWGYQQSTADISSGWRWLQR